MDGGYIPEAGATLYALENDTTALKVCGLHNNMIT